jgi:CelD/BcsL family acetyltransferase involved in cellulose biosynthesis
VTVKLTGTAANLAADWTTLTGTNFASPSAEIAWNRA